MSVDGKARHPWHRLRAAPAAWYRSWREGWRETLRSSAVAQRLPAEAVRVLAPDGTDSLWRGGRRLAGSADEAKFEALVLPAALVLRHGVPVPAGTPQAWQALAARELAAANPFGREAVAWGWDARPASDGKQHRLVLALAARGHIDRYIASQRHRLRCATPEIWADTTPPLILDGYGEGARRRREAATRRTCGALLAAAVVLAATLAAMPTYLAHRRAALMQSAVAAFGAESDRLSAARAALDRANSQARALAAHFAARTEMLGLLTRLSEAVPDQAYLDLVEVHGQRVLITGRAANAAALMDSLAAQPGFGELRAPVAIARDPTTGKELFSLEFKLASAAGQP